MSDDKELIERLRAKKQKGNRFDSLEYEAADRIEALKRDVEMFRETNRRMNRRVQLFEGWWQRRVARADRQRSLYLGAMVRGNPNIAGLEELAYQRGFDDGHDARFHMPKRVVKPRRIKGESHE